MTHTDLDPFDRALLTELRLVAAEGAPRARRTTRKRWALSGAGIAAAAVTAFGISTLGSPAAYAVEEDGDGDVVITIRELDDASGLERALADHGIDAEVDYRADATRSGSVSELHVDHPDPDDVDRAEGRTLESEDGGSGGAELQVGPDGSVPDDLPCGDLERMPFTTELTDDEFVITIPSDSILRESDSTLRIATSGDIDDRVAGLDVAFSVGDVFCGFGTASVGIQPGQG